MQKKTEWYEGFVREQLEDTRKLREMYEELERMVRPEWVHNFDGIDDVMAVIDTTPSDAINSGAIAMSGANPRFSISPLAPNVYEYDKVEAWEDNLSWHFRKSNRTGLGSVLYDMAWSSLLYNTIAVQVYDLYRIFPTNQKIWTPRQKAAWRNGRFIVRVRNPKGVMYEDTPYGVGAVCHVQQYRPGEIIEFWKLWANNDTDEGRMIAQAVKEMEERVGNPSEQTESMRFVQYSVQEDDRVVVGGQFSIVDDIGSIRPNFEIKIVDKENEEGFKNWSVRVAGARLEEKREYYANPLLAPIYWSKSWDKLNLASSLIMSEPVRRAREPRGVTFTHDGKAPLVDRKNGNLINMRVGEEFRPLQAFSLDQGGLAIVQQMQAQMNRTTGASVLGDNTSVSSDTPFATYSAMIKIALSRLDRQRLITGDSVADVCKLFMEWVNATDKPLVSYSNSIKQTRGTRSIVPPGTQMAIMPGSFDLNAMEMEVKIMPSTPVDEAAQIAAAIQLSTQLNVPMSQVLEEKLGYENVAMMYERWVNETLSNADVQAEIAKRAAYAQTSGQLEAQMEMQAAMQEQQMAAQGAPPGMDEGGVAPPMGEGGGMSQAAFGALGGSEFNPAIGGASTAQFQPGMTRETLNGGRTMNEEQI